MSIITGWRAIAQTFRVTQAVAKDWREEGAPILLLPGGKKETVPAVHIPELWAWLSGRYGPKAQGLASAPASRPADGKPSSLSGPFRWVGTPSSPCRPGHAPHAGRQGRYAAIVTAGVASGAAPSCPLPPDRELNWFLRGFYVPLPGSERSRAPRTFPRRHQLPAATTGLFLSGVRTLVVTATTFAWSTAWPSGNNDACRAILTTSLFSPCPVAGRWQLWVPCLAIILVALAFLSAHPQLSPSRPLPGRPFL